MYGSAQNWGTSHNKTTLAAQVSNACTTPHGGLSGSMVLEVALDASVTIAGSADPGA
jgi:hypothetical protein